MKHFIALLCLVCLASAGVEAQCECVDCPVFLPNNAVETSELEISGATNDTLGQGGQQLVAVCINLNHDAIDEIDFEIIAPNGSSVLLIDNTGISVNDDMDFQICFVACSEQAFPDRCFSETFDSSEPWVEESLYEGSYYPAVGCLEDLAGSSVNGTWTIQSEDFVGGDPGTLLDWCLVFADDTGLGCDQSCYDPTCNADGGLITELAGTYCQGDAGLELILEPNCPGQGPDPTSYGYYYSVVDVATGELVRLSANTDYQDLPEGEYQICGLSYLLTDEPQLPLPIPAGYTIGDLIDDIDNEVFCADQSDNCFTITISEPGEQPGFTGPTVVCVGVQVEYVIDNFDPSITYLFQIIQGSFVQFIPNADGVSVIWADGPGEICVSYDAGCGLVDSCLLIDVSTNPDFIEVDGPDPICEGAQVPYTITPALAPGESYDITVVGGDIINLTGNVLTVLWTDANAVNQICVEILGSASCPPSPICELIDVTSSFDAEIIDWPPVVCVGDLGQATAQSSPGILDYLWSSPDFTIVSGQGTSSIEFESGNAGTGDICVQYQTDCGITALDCREIEFVEAPQPQITIIEPDPICGGSVFAFMVFSAGSTVEWTQTEGPPSLVIVSPQAVNPEILIFEAGIYTLEVTESNGSCSATDEIQFEVAGQPEIFGLDEQCDNNGFYQVTFEITGGVGPYNVNGDPVTGNIFTSDLIVSGESYSFQISDVNGCETEVQGEVTCACATDAGSVGSELLEACGGLGESVFVTANNDETLDGDDALVFIVHDLPGNTLGNIFLESTTGVIVFAAGMVYGETYYISAVAGNSVGGGVDLNDPCLSVSPGQPVIFYDVPSVSFDPITLQCSGTFPFTFDLSDDVSEVSWQPVTNPGPVVISAITLDSFDINVSAPGLYQFEALISNGNCAVIELIEFEVAESLEIIDVEVECITADSFVLSLQISGGVGPFTVNIPGQITGGLFLSEPLSILAQTTVVVEDVQGCTGEITVGPVQCDCTSQAGAMSSDTITVCEDATSVNIDFLGGDVSDADDIGSFVLHSGSGNIIVDPIFVFQGNSFGLVPGLIPGQVYYISRVVGNNIGGLTDLNDPCLSVSAGQPLLILPLPTFDIAEFSSGCVGDIVIPIQNAADGVVSIISNSSGATVTADISAPGELTVSASAPTTLEISYAEGVVGCELIDTLTVIFFDLPVLGTPQVVCLGQQAVIEFEIFGGLPPYIVNGQPFVGSTYTSDTIQSGQSASFTVVDDRGCSVELTQEVDCNCTSEAGQLLNDPLVACVGESIDFGPLIWNEPNVEFDDIAVVIVYSGAVDSVGQVLSTIQGTSIDYNTVFVPGETYYFGIAVGNEFNGSYDPDDPCLDFTNGVPIVWQPVGEVSIDGGGEFCIGELAQLDLTVVGDLPVTITLVSSLFRDTVLVLTNPNSSVQIDVLDVFESWSIAPITNACLSVSGIADVTGVEEVIPTFRSGTEVCNVEEFGSVLELSSLILQSASGSWSSPDFTISGNSIDFDGSLPGFYDLTFSTVGFYDPCAGADYTVQVQVLDCICPVATLPDSLILCSQDGSIDLVGTVPIALSGAWSVENINGLPNAPVLNAGVLDVQNASAGTFLLSYLLSEPVPIDCDSTFTIDLVIEGPAITGDQLSIPVYCRTDSGTIDLFELIEGEDPTGGWLFNDLSVNPVISLADLSSGQNTFVYTLGESTLCGEQRLNVNVFVEENVPAGVQVEFPVLCRNESVQIDLNDLVEGIAQGGQWSGTSNTILSDDLSTGLNTFVYTSRDGDCAAEPTVVEIVVLPAPQLGDIMISGPDQVEAGEIFTLELSDLDSIDLIEWHDESSALSSGVPLLSVSISQPTLFRAVVTLLNGCTVTSEIFVDLLDIQSETPVYIPNVFNPTSPNPANTRFGIRDAQGVEAVQYFKIFDRWGATVYSAEDQAPGSTLLEWDGTHNGQLVNPGVFVYAIAYRTLDGDDVVRTGDVTVIR